jgi:hypothetical protein
MFEFYSLLIASSILVLLLSFVNDDRVKKFYLFITIYFFVLCIFKPVGISADDENYISILSALSNDSFEESGGIGGSRDFIWAYLVYLLSFGSYSFVGVKILAGLSFLIKAYVIRRYCKNYLFALSIYINTFFILHDTIQYRTSLAVSLLFLFIFLFEKPLSRVLIFLLAIFSHLQAVVIIVPAIIKKIKLYKYFTCLIIFSLIIPNITNLFSLQIRLVKILESLEDNAITINIKRYIYQFNGSDVNSISYIVLGSILIYAYKKQKIINFDICINAVLASFLCYGLLYGVPDLRWRLADYLTTTVCMIAGSMRAGFVMKLLFAGYAILSMYKQFLLL